MNRDPFWTRPPRRAGVIVAAGLLAFGFPLASTPPAGAISVLHFTAPDRAGRGPGDCSENPTLLLFDSLSIRIYASRQSPTWADSSAVLLADSAGFTRLWPTVREQASAVVLRSKPVARGAADSIRIPQGGPWLACWFAAVKIRNGLKGCDSRKFQMVPPALPAAALPAIAIEGPILSAVTAPDGETVAVSLGAGEGPCELRVFDVTGRVVLAMGWPFAIRRRVVLDARSWAPGLYFVRARIGARTRVARLVVVR